MNTDEIVMALGETDLDLQNLLARAVEKRNALYRAEAERLQAERLAKKAQAEEEVVLSQKVYQSRVRDALEDAVNRQNQTRFCPSETEIAMVSGEIPFDSAQIRSTSWRYFSQFHAFEIQKARHSLAMARQKLSRISQEQLSYGNSSKS